jgi:glycosyltransferase involved in cell wall biosynthesis
MKNKTRIPKVSVVLPVYNAVEYLELALNSILTQTFRNFEFIIVDDHSTDGSFEILMEYAKKNKKIKLFRNTKNRGVSETVKKAIRQCRGEYIARMDADDVSLPTRLEKQLKYLEQNKDTVALGGQCLTIDSENRITGNKTFPNSFEEIYKYIFHFIPVQQPTLMIARNRLPKRFVYYVDGMNTAEEVELFFKLFNYGKVENLPDTLLLYRIHDKNTSMKNVKETFLLTLIARIKAIFKYNYKPTKRGILYTFLQSIIVLLLPQRFILSLYKFTRNTPFVASPQYIDYNMPYLSSYLLHK